MNLAVVTGADGFIGSHLLAYLNRLNIPAVGLVMRGSPTLSRISSLPNTTVIECGLNEWEELSSCLPQAEITAFYHLAWAGVSPEDRLSLSKQLPNLELSLNALRLASAAGAQRFILPGSTLEYIYAGKPIDETALPTPQNAYGAVKLAVRYLCEAFAKEHDLPFIYAVSTGVYGAERQDNNVITYTIQKLLRGERPSLTKLEQKWDYIHIDDLVRALYLIGEKGRAGAFYAIGRGDNCPLSQYIHILHQTIDRELPLGIGEVPYPSDILPSSCINLAALQRDTGFVPEIRFEDGIREVIESMKEAQR